jgi:hypothetical protein
MTTVQRVALAFGIGFLVAAIAGFAGTGMSNMDPDPGTAPRALGCSPSTCCTTSCTWRSPSGASRRSAASAPRARTAAPPGVIYLVLAVLGFVAPDGFGLVPLGGNDIWLHLALGAPLAYFGFTAHDRAVGVGEDLSA